MPDVYSEMIWSFLETRRERWSSRLDSLFCFELVLMKSSFPRHKIIETDELNK
jgi:hypothetical protein